ncbi:MAG: hypothetical protein IPJ66_17105 [Bacteroidetes bacterium]|nr:hypothetical protein [Bacteroidota bacterium]
MQIFGTVRKYLPLLIQSVADSESWPVDLVYLQDRIFMRQDKKQVLRNTGRDESQNRSTGILGRLRMRKM